MINTFQDIREQEAEFIKAQKERIDQCQRVMGLADQVLSLQGAPGWQHFVDQIEAIRTRSRREMELCKGDDSDLRILQGRCQALGSILSVMKDAENNRRALAEQMKIHQDVLKERVRSDGKVKPVGPIGGT